MDKHKDGFPETYHILPNPFKPILKALGSLCTMHQLSDRSDHFNRGGGPLLDEMLYDLPVDEVE